jgi:hypothetical protein
MEGFFHARAGKIEPRLKELSPQLDRKARGLPSAACLGMMTLDQNQQFRPRHHLIQKKLPLTHTKLLEPRL